MKLTVRFHRWGRRVARTIYPSWKVLAVFLVSDALAKSPECKAICRRLSLLLDIPFGEFLLVEFRTILQALSWWGLITLLFRRELRLLHRLVRTRRRGVKHNLGLVLFCLIGYGLWMQLLEFLFMPHAAWAQTRNVPTTPPSPELISRDSWHFLLISLASLIAIPVGEELLYRGALLFTAMSLLGKWPGIVLSSLIFGLQHFDEWGLQGWYPTACTTGFALIASFILFRTGRLRWCVLFHGLWNLYVKI